MKSAVVISTHQTDRWHKVISNALVMLCCLVCYFFERLSSPGLKGEVRGIFWELMPLCFSGSKFPKFTKMRSNQDEWEAFWRYITTFRVW